MYYILQIPKLRNRGCVIPKKHIGHTRKAVSKVRDVSKLRNQNDKI